LQVEPIREGGAERLVYVMPERATPDDDVFDLVALWNVLWLGKWPIIATTFLFTVASVILAISLTEWYRAEVLLAPSDASAVPAIGGQLGGLAALAGVSSGGGESAEALAILRSRDFARDFIEEFNLLEVFFADDWDEQTGKWRIPDEDDWPDQRDAIKFFHEDVLSVSEAFDTGLVTLAIEWTDPAIAAEWAMVLVERLNHRVRQRALLEAETNVAYLQGELTRTNIVTLQQAIGRLLEAEMQKLMLARGNEEFAFRIIDSAEIPKERSRPRRALIVMTGAILGGLLGVLFVVLRRRVGDHKVVGTHSV
jgi:LPS O-antigen subunit length determinant protein (WzzB/FepE family)